MKSDFAKVVYVQVVDREDEKPILVAETNIDDLGEKTEHDQVGIYRLESIKKLSVTRSLR